MQSESTHEALKPLEYQEKVTACDLIPLLESLATKIKVLSLDCFDTLLWRKTATPVDVFFNLAQKPAFAALGYTSSMRIQGESSARRMKIIQHQTNEVQLSDIYRHSFPHLTDDEVNLLAHDEVSAEIEVCYSFWPIIELIRKAQTLNIKIIIVSDTYLKHDELKRLLTATMPQDIMSAINTIFCSNEYGHSKPRGLFKHVLKKIGHTADEVLHIGDNIIADFVAPRALKLRAAHLVALNENLTNLFRLQTTAASFMHPSIRNTRAMTSPFRAVLATKNLDFTKPEQMLGYVAMGPILYSFAKFIQHEISELKKQGGNPKILFLMRDAYLPSLVCAAIEGQEIGKRVCISRFASVAASFRTVEDIDLYLAEVVATNRFKDIAAQLLLPDEIATRIINKTLQAKDPVWKFLQLIREKSIQNLIILHSKHYFKRLSQHLKNEVNLQPGDTLIFVDLGYSGSAQRKLEPIFRKELNVNILGRYLIALPIPGWEDNRCGLLDKNYCDERAMHTLVSYIALLEQICTSNDKSVIDYDEEGNPKFKDHSFSKQQYDKLDLIQGQCIQFAKDAEDIFKKSGTVLAPVMLKDAAMAELARLIYLPTEAEINYLENFQFDLGLGTSDIYKVFDREAGLVSLRRRGMFSLFMEKNAKSFRTNTPAELRAAGVELSLALLAQHRYTLEFGLNDLSLRREQINILIVEGNSSIQKTLEAQLTHDGYYSILIPIGSGNYKIGILLGQKYQWVQLESAEVFKMNSFLSYSESQHTEDCWSSLLFGEMIDRGGKLFECSSKASVLVIDPPKKIEGDNYILRIIFRPVVNNQ